MKVRRSLQIFQKKTSGTTLVLLLFYSSVHFKTHKHVISCIPSPMLRLLRRSVPIASIGRLGERGTALPAAAATVAAARLCETQRRGVSTSTLLHHQYKTPAQQHAWQQVSDGSKRAIKEVMGHSALTQVQADTLPLSLLGSNVLAKAKTGKGRREWGGGGGVERDSVREMEHGGAAQIICWHCSKRVRRVALFTAPPIMPGSTADYVGRFTNTTIILFMRIAHLPFK